jgi:drug/metabolite transporter (DMT)-like permease
MTSSDRPKQNRGWLYGILAQGFWGTAPVVTSLITHTLSTGLLVALRHGMGAVFLGANILTGQRRVLKHQPWLHIIVLGLLAGSLPDLLLTESIRHAGPIVAIMLARLEIPLGVLFAHLLLKENVSRRAYVASLVGVVGAAFISYKPGLAIDFSGGFYFGIAMGVGAGLAWSLSSVYAKYILNRKADPLTVTFSRLSLGSLTALLLTIVFVNQPFLILSRLDLHQWLLIIYLGIFSSGVGYLLFYRSLNIIDVHVAQVLIGITMVVAVIFGLIVGVKVTALQWLGIAIIGWSLYLIKATPAPIEPLD